VLFWPDASRLDHLVMSRLTVLGSSVSALPCRLTSGAVDLLVILGIIVPLLLGARFKLHWFPTLVGEGPLSIGIAIAIGCLALVPIAVTLLLASQKSRRTLLIAAWGIIGIALVLRTAWVLAVDNSFTSDYLTMWNYVIDLVNGVRAWDASIAQEIRTIPFLAPIGIWSGGNPLAFQLANVVVGVLSLGLVFYFAQLFGGIRACLIALGLAAFAPEPWFANEIPTHDIPGTFLMLAALTCFALAIRSSDQPGAALVFLLWAGLGGVIAVR
jgi:4-amino-4-deoxy-L-arabinose transferase-like glycosyltransferase